MPDPEGMAGTVHAAIGRGPGAGVRRRFLRMWDYYLGYCEGAFRERHIGDMQLVLTKQRTAVPPATGVFDRMPSAVAP